ncbi:MAG: hypothetical protein WC337_07585 [Candidatus Muiribacteriota bacterium]
MITILSIGLENIYFENRRKYNEIGKFSDINIICSAPKYAYFGELIKFNPVENEEENFTLSLFEPENPDKKNFKKYSTLTADYLLSVIEEHKPDIIEIYAEPYQQIAHDILKIISDIKPKPATVLKIKKDPSIWLFGKLAKYRKFVYNNIDFVLVPDELTKKFLINSGCKAPYKILPEMVFKKNSPTKDYSGKLLITLDIDKNNEKSLLPFLKITDYIPQLKYFFLSNPQIAYKFHKKNFETDVITKVSSEEKTSIVLSSDLSVFYRKYDFSDTEFIYPIIQMFYNKIPIILGDEFPYNKIFKNLCFFSGEIDEYTLKKIIVDINFRQNFIEKAYEYANKTYSPETVTYKLFEIYKFLYKMRKIEQGKSSNQ